jgi:hypothetical protein
MDGTRANGFRFTIADLRFTGGGRARDVRARAGAPAIEDHFP